MCMVKDFAEKYDVISGLSDHTLGATVPKPVITILSLIIIN